MKLPYLPVEFVSSGELADGAVLAAAVDLVTAAGATDVLLIAHGWNNDMGAAQSLFDAICDRVADGLDDPSRVFAVVGVLWPSTRWADDDDLAGGGLSVEGELDELTARIAEVVEDDAVAARLAASAPDLESAEARKEFVAALRKLLPKPKAVSDDDAMPDTLLDGDALELFARAADAPRTGTRRAPAAGAGAVAPGIADPLDAGGAAPGPGGAAGFEFGKLNPFNAARQLLNLTSFYAMKDRAGQVGAKGVAALVDALAGADPRPRIHLAGHSFGARVATSAATGSAASISSITLLQAAFSHLGFAGAGPRLEHDGAFRRTVTSGNLHGPAVVTHAHNDKAVGISYALASRLARQVGADVGDGDDPYGGLGANGAVSTTEATADQSPLKASDGQYAFEPGKIYNLLADEYVSGHSDIRGAQVANALRQAMLAGQP